MRTGQGAPTAAVGAGAACLAAPASDRLAASANPAVPAAAAAVPGAELAATAADLAAAVRAEGRWPRGLYVHIPYCAAVCPYCDFNVYAIRSAEQLEAMVQAVLDEAEGWARLAADAAGGFETVFIGGGTPSLLSARQLRRLVEGLRARLPLSRATEWSLEANPGTLTPARVEALRELGIGRISLGVQSFDPDELRRLGRTHTPRQVQRSLRLLFEAGLDNVNIDLMFALPGQSLKSWQHSLQMAVAAGVPHVSAYCLTLEEGTPFHRLWRQGRLKVAAEGLQARMYRLAVEVLQAAGLRRYEVSNFSRPGWECRHNLNYWRAGTYLGLGPGAHSHWAGFRFANCRKLQAYVEAAAAFRSQARQAAARRARPEQAVSGWGGTSNVADQAAGHRERAATVPGRVGRGGVGEVPTVAFVERLTVGQQMDEFLLLHLRLREGVSREAFRARFGCWPEEVYPAEVWQALEELGLLRRARGRWRLTDRGFLVADAVTARLVHARQDLLTASPQGPAPGTAGSASRRTAC